METMDMNLIPVLLESPQPLLVRCLICFQTPFFINQGLRRADSKIDYFCEAFNLTEVSIKTGLRMSPLCNDCLELIESIGAMLKSIRDIEVNLNAQKQAVVNLLRLDDFTQSPEELEGSNTKNFTTFQFRKNIQKKLKVFPDVPFNNKDEGRFAVSVLADDAHMDSGLIQESPDDSVYESVTFVDECKDEIYSMEEDDPLKIIKSEEDENNSRVATIKYALPEGIVLKDCTVLLKRVTTAEHERHAMKTRTRKQNLKNLRQEYTERRLRRTKQNSAVQTKNQATNRIRKLSIINRKDMKGTRTPRRNGNKPVLCNFVNSKNEKCRFCFKDEESMLAHVRRIHHLKGSFCELCGTSFKRKAMLLTHRVVAHGEPFPFVCSEVGCGKGFNEKRYLLEHKFVHTGNYPYPCDKCSRGFATEAKLEVHSAVHLRKDSNNSEGEDRICELCGMSFDSKRKLSTHKAVAHGELFPYICPEEGCGKGFTEKRYLLEHKFVHTGNYPYPCDKCSRGFATEAKLEVHSAVHLKKDSNNSDCEGEDPVCELCETSFGSKRKLRTHKAAAHGELFPYICPEEGCGKGFNDKRYLSQHKFVHTGNYPYPCDKCSRGFATEAKLEVHSAVHLKKDSKNSDCEGEDRICELCGTSFDSKRKLSAHKAVAHGQFFPYVCPEEGCGKGFKEKRFLWEHKFFHTGNYPYPCNKCSRGFATAAKLGMHSTVHLNKDSKNSDCEGEDRICELCEMSFDTKRKLLEHKAVAHGRPFLFICPVEGCGKGYTTKTNLSQHKFFHTGNYPYRCDKCNRGFTAASRLAEHSAVHLDKDSKNFVCEVCGKTYKSEKNVRMHKLRHLGRSHKCTLCTWSFKSAGGLQSHMAVHTELRPYLCQECGACFKIKRHLDRHLKNHGRVVKRKFGFRKRKLKPPPAEYDSILAVNNPEEIMQEGVDPGSAKNIPKV